MSVPTAGPKRPFGLVFVVFYWVIVGFGYVVGGSIVAGLSNFVGTAAGGSDSGPFSRLSGEIGLRLAILELVGFLLFLSGLLTLVACYGLWTYRRWGLQLARALAGAYAVIGGIAVIASLYTRAGIVYSIAWLVLSVGVLYYLLHGSLNMRDRFQKYVQGSPLRGEDWERFE